MFQNSFFNTAKIILPKNIITAFLLSSILFKIIASILFLIDTQHAPMLEVYKFFSIPETLRQVSMLAIPSTWPMPDIKSYTYDFSVVYAISANMNVISDKPLVMPDNILPYGPLAFVLFHLFSLIKIETALAIYRTVSTIFLCAVVFFAASRLSNRTTSRLAILAVSILVCTPFAIFVSSGNIEIFLFSTCLLVLLIKDKYPVTAAVLIGICTAIKYYPVIFMLEFIKDRNFKAFALSLCVAITLFLLPFGFFHGGFLANLKFTFDQISQASRLCYDNAAQFCTAGGLSMGEFFYNLGLPLWIENALYKLTSFFIVITGIWSYVQIKSRPLSIMVLITVVCLIPQVSVFYKLAYLMIPILLSDQHEKSSTHNVIAMLVALCVSPLPFYWALNFSGLRADFSFLVFTIHVTLVVYALRYRFNLSKVEARMRHCILTFKTVK